MCSFKRIAVSNRSLCPRPLSDQVLRLGSQIDTLILREKDLTENDYTRLAAQVSKACAATGIEFICHTFVRSAEQIGCPNIHLPFSLFREMHKDLAGFTKIGVSVHSLEEARRAQLGGASYVVAGNIFETDCKKGMVGRGTAFLKELCENLSLPVYGIGGITDQNQDLIKAAGARGACRMSDYMKK